MFLAVRGYPYPDARTGAARAGLRGLPVLDAEIPGSILRPVQRAAARFVVG